VGQTPKSSVAKSCRLFFTVGTKHYQLFTFSQNRKDGSIYFSAPNFGEINWLIPLNGDLTPVLLAYKVGDQGKLSLHGTGVAHTSPHSAMGQNKFRVPGHELKAQQGQSLGVRHLVTVLISEPSHLPPSPAFNRRNDGAFHSKELHPYVIVFWAVPVVSGLSINLNGSFAVDDLEEVPPHAGWNMFRLPLHYVLWFAYRTKYMNRWPSEMQACYCDGYFVPMIIGAGEEGVRLELRRPNYRFLGSKLLTIEI